MQIRVAGLTFGALALVSACATSSVTPGGARYSAAPLEQPVTAASARGAIDSMYAQSIADREGPRVGIRADVSFASGSRRVRGVFHLEDDAYVMIGHVDANGIVRIVFPMDPHDDGFVQGGGKYYQTAEFFGGFNEDYSFRYATLGRYSGPQTDSYDASAGYLFIVASWRPMHFEKLTDGNKWDSFEVTTEDYRRDPRPAIKELASVLVGDSREAYTVAFAPYYKTTSSTYGSGAGYSSLGLSLCSNSYFGFAQSIPLAYLAPGIGGSYQDFSYRGRNYAYDSFGDCAYARPAFYYSGFGAYQSYANGPNRPGQPATQPVTRGRVLGATDVPRRPFEPRPPVTRVAADKPADTTTASKAPPARVSPEYRNRGLITTDRPGDVPARATAHFSDDQRSRPSIQEMTERRTQNAFDGNGNGRTRIGNDNSNAARDARDARDRNSGNGARRVNADDSPRNPTDRTQMIDRARDRDQQTRANDNPRTANPRTEQPPRSEPRSAPQPRIEQPRVEQPHSAPQPRSEQPRSAPPARASEPSRPTPPPSSGTPPKSTP